MTEKELPGYERRRDMMTVYHDRACDLVLALAKRDGVPPNECGAVIVDVQDPAAVAWAQTDFGASPPAEQPTGHDPVWVFPVRIERLRAHPLIKPTLDANPSPPLGTTILVVVGGGALNVFPVWITKPGPAVGSA
jgi:hypothetical protein